MGIGVDEAIRVAGGLPEVEQRQYNTDVVSFRVRGKGFLYLNEAERVATVKATREEQAALVGGDPEVFTATWASGRFAWVGVRLPLVDPGEFAELVTEAWRLTAPKRLVAAYP